MKSRSLNFIGVSIGITVLVVIATVVFQSKSQLNDHSSFWKPRDNPVLGDVLQFSYEANNFRNDTLFKNKIPIAVVLELENRFFCGDRIMTIKSIKTGQIGTYCEK